MAWNRLWPLRSGRLRPRDWLAIDAAVAAGYFGVLAGFSLPHVFHAYLGGHAGMLSPRPWLAWVAAIMAAAPVAVRRRFPRAALSGAVPGMILGQAAGLHAAPFPAIGYVLYSVALTGTRRDATAALVLTEAGVVAAFAASPGLGALPLKGGAAVLPSFLLTMLIQGAVWVIGRAVRQQRAYARGLAEQAARRTQAEIDAARSAVTEQRLQIARDLHDVIAHSVGLMTVQAGAARMLAGAHPEETQRLLAELEATGRECLRETRQVLGMLRAGDRPADPGGHSPPGDPAMLMPAPGLNALPALTARHARSNVTVAVRTAGQPRGLPAALDQDAYRIIQEAVTNVARHSTAGCCQVEVSYRARELSIRITNPAAGQRAPVTVPAAAGHGLIGMRERVMLHGGQFSAGPLPGGGFGVSATMPLPEATT